MIQVANHTYVAVRGILKTAWRLGQMDTETYMQAKDVQGVNGSRLPAGRALDKDEIHALFSVCAHDTLSGACDAVLFSLLYGCGLRRAEAATLCMADVNMRASSIRVLGKGNKERLMYLVDGSMKALKCWLKYRDRHDGALLHPVHKNGTIKHTAMTPCAIRLRLKVRSRQAGIETCSPHDLRRSFVSSLLDAGADLSAVQQLAGHASVNTTARYDRRGERTKQQAAELLHVPFTANGRA